ncbi:MULTISPECIES: phage tail protein, partial [unclassified Pasteurella]|uniref:phage tail protein n=1 Tax=unclassified Pasteurella TaxID=2621516 RepID=UPI0011021B52
MASQYFAILTDYGTTAFAKALSSKQPLQLTTFAVGDGNGRAVTPTANRTALAREKHRAPVSAVSLDPRNNKQVIVELTIPENIGGFYIREMGVFDNHNKLIAYANCPESFKPLESSGSGKIQVLRMILKVASSNAVTLSVDHSVIFVTRQQLTPKTITATTQNGFDESGHSHEIAKASTTQMGITQHTNNYNGDSETLSLSQKGAKAIKALIDSVTRNLSHYIPNSKKSDAIDSTSSDTIATSFAVKKLDDKIRRLNFYKINVKGSATPVTFDLSNREHWIAEIGMVYRGNGHYQLNLHNNATSTITNLPLNDKSAVQLDISVMGAYTLIRCHYVYLNRTFESKADWNQATLNLSWHENLKLDRNGKVPRDTVFARSLESNYRVVIRRNEARFTPYMHMIDQSVDMAADSVQQKGIAEIISRVGEGDGVPKSMLKTILLADKNISFEVGGWNAAQQYQYFLKGFSRTGNVVIGSAADDGTARLQVGGDINVKGSLVVTNSSWAKHKFPINNGGEWRLEFNPNSESDPRFNIVYKMQDNSSRYCSFPKLERNETVAYRA